MHLALDDHRVDPGAAVVDRDEPPHRDHSGAGVDVDDADVGAVRIGQVLRVVTDLRLEAALDARPAAPRAVGAHGDLLDGHRLLVGSPSTWNDALLPLQVGHRDLEHPGGDEPGLVAHLAGDQRRGRAATPAWIGCRRCPARTASGRCRRARPRCRRAGCRSPRRRSGRTSSRGPAPGSGTTPAATALPVGWTRSSEPSAMPRPRMSMSLRGPAPTASVKNEMPMPISSPRARRCCLLAAQLVVVRRSASPRAGSARSCRSRRSSRSWWCRGTARAATGCAAAVRPGPAPARAARQSTIRSTR